MRKRKPVRLKNYDYSQEGYYFVTICVKDRACWFGEIAGQVMQANNHGKIALTCWHDLPNHYPHVGLDLFVIMPNHVHGIVCIVGNGLKPFPTAKRHGLSEIIRAFKTFSSRRINESLKSGEKFQWQKSFYEHVIRNEKSLQQIREYIVQNPLAEELEIRGILS
jgi:REP element-mobilizing transposase RayT